MSKDIEDEAAIEFAAALYQAIAFGRSMDAAFRLGCNALRLKQIPEEQTPRLKIKAGGDAGSLVFVGLR